MYMYVSFCILVQIIIYIDGTDVQVEGQWVLTASTEPFHAEFFYVEEPNGFANENCIAYLSGHFGGFVDIACGTGYSGLPLCEYIF